MRVPFLSLLVLLGVRFLTIARQSCAANERFGEVEEQVYISRGSPSREPEHSSLQLWLSIKKLNFSPWLLLTCAM
jgi:hypothetical protein